MPRRRGYLLPRRGSEPARRGYLLPRRGSEPARRGYLPAQRGYLLARPHATPKPPVAQAAKNGQCNGKSIRLI